MSTRCFSNTAPRCFSLLPSVDQSRVVQIAVETTGPLLNTDFCVRDRGGRRRCRCRRCR